MALGHARRVSTSRVARRNREREEMGIWRLGMEAISLGDPLSTGKADSLRGKGASLPFGKSA